jgi:hypothetical protein
MSQNSKLVVHAGGIRRSRTELASLHTPPPTDTWKPVPHSLLVGELIRGLERQNVVVVKDDYATMGKDDAKLFGAMNLRIPDLDTAEFSMALGLRGANDKSMSIQVLAGARIFVCDNLAFSGGSGSVFLKKRHTSRLDLAAIVPNAIDQFLEKAGAFKIDLEKMMNHALTDNRAKEVIHDSFAGVSPVMPLRCFPDVSRLYFDDDEQRDKFPDRTLWSLNNAFTEAVKALKAAPQHNSGIRIGRLFGRLVNKIKPEPIAMIDGIEVYR